MKNVYSGRTKLIALLLIALVCFCPKLVPLAKAGTVVSLETGWQQEIRIKGQVVDEKTFEPLPGVNIRIDGTTEGTITDLDGKFELKVPSTESVLNFSFIGYEPQKITVGNQTQMTISLKQEVKKLDEVIVIGYGTAKRSDYSGASVTVSSEQLRNSASANIDQALQGKAAGVSTTITSGQPGSAVSMRIRGVGTLQANAEPLYIIDGVEIRNNAQSGHAVGLGDKLGNGSNQTFSGLSSINPADILSIEVLKDASATAIYGSKGAFGVVMITTKRGKTGDARFTYDFSYGIQKQIKRIDMMNLREYAEYSNGIAAETNGRDPRVELQDPSILGDGENWQGAVFRTAPMQSHQISASGGTDKVRYFVSGSYFGQDGTVIGSDFKRYTGRVNLDADLKKWLKLGANFSAARSEEHIGLNNSSDGIISVALRTTPDVPIYNTDGSWSGDEREGSAGSVNPIAKALDEENRLVRANLNGNFFTEITFMKGLVLHSEIGLDIGNSNAYTFVPTYQYGTVKNTSNSVSRQYNQNTYYQVKNYLTYSKEIRKHSITLMAGQEASEWKYENLRGASSGLSSNDIQEPGLGQTSTMTIGSGHGSGAMASFYGRGTYNYDAKYYMTYTFRRDGSSNFGPENRFAPFHSVAVSWRINNENFFKPLEPIVNNLKIRAGWGQTGNANIGGYQWGASITKMPTGLGQGFRQSNIANPFIQWETQEQLNLGFDLGLYKDRVSLVIDLYKKTAKDMLMRAQLPSYLGTSGNESARLNPPMGNFGEMENKGVEITLNAKPLVGDFSWDINAQITVNRNKLISLTGSPTAHIEGYGQWTDLVSLTRLGEPLYNFYGYKVVGVYKDKADIESSPKPKAYPSDGNYNRTRTVWVGDLKYADLSGPDGKPDGVIDDYDRTDIGSPMPKFTYGLTNTFRYKNIELNIFLTGAYGNKIMNYVGRSISGMETMWSNQTQSAVDRARAEAIDANKVYPILDKSGNQIWNWFDDIDNVRLKNPGTSIPRAISGDPNNNMRISDRYIEDGSYLRVKNITLSYIVPASLTNKYGISNLKLFANLQNVWTFTKYEGFDPEVGASQTSDFVSGLDNGRYPSPRIYTFGVNVSF
jgi:TonB-dependent starch-binding outer membrane protein SusC